MVVGKSGREISSQYNFSSPQQCKIFRTKYVTEGDFTLGSGCDEVILSDNECKFEE